MDENPFKHNPLGINQARKSITPEERKVIQERLQIEARIAKPEDWENLRDLRLVVLEEDGKKMGVSDEEIQKIKKRTAQEWEDVFGEGENKFTILVSSGSEIVGMGRVENLKGVWWLGYLCVKKEFRGIGLGSKISAMRLNEIRIRGGKEVWARINDINDESMANSESFGFRRVNTIPEKLRRILNSGLGVMKLENINNPRVIKKINEVLNAG